MVTALVVLLVVVGILGQDRLGVLGSMNGGWSPWDPWYACTVSCGGGVRMRQRECDNPTPSGNGRYCPGASHQSSACNTHRCEDSGARVDGEWSRWSRWMKCTATCGGGYRFRDRQCDSPSPSRNGRYCLGEGLGMTMCNTQRCSYTSPDK